MQVNSIFPLCLGLMPENMNYYSSDNGRLLLFFVSSKSDVRYEIASSIATSELISGAPVFVETLTVDAGREVDDRLVDGCTVGGRFVIVEGPLIGAELLLVVGERIVVDWQFVLGYEGERVVDLLVVVVELATLDMTVGCVDVRTVMDGLVGSR